jgi:aminopeptidase N
VIRLPFILNSSLPHEVLHNWWGNGVFVDYDKGNWCEGLTTYMGDHWQQDIVGQGASYRLKTLINYADFVGQNPANEFPVREFRGRHDASSQAIGYGKTMMIFRMLEMQFGKEVFKKALQDFYKENLFKKASFEEIQAAFEKATGANLAAFFYQWLDRKGAPEVALGDVKVSALMDGGFQTSFALLQNQMLAYDFMVPVVWTLSSGEEVRQLVRLMDKVQLYTFASSLPPVRVAIDPQYDLFRKLYLEERPATLSAVLGSKNVRFYLNTKDAGSTAFTKKWQESLSSTSLHDVTSGFAPNNYDSLVLVGDRPEFREFMRDQLVGQNWNSSESGYQVLGESYLWSETSSVIVARRKNNPQQVIVWVRWQAGNDPAEWAGRLTHYGTFGVLIFKGRPNVLKTTWPVTSSPLIRAL